MAKQHNPIDNLVLVSGKQSTDDQDDISSLTITDLPTLSHLHDPEEDPQHQHAVHVHILEHTQLRHDVPEELLQEHETVCNELNQVCGNNSEDNSVLSSTRKDG